MATYIDPLVIGRVIGDVVDIFVPSVAVNVYFANKHVTNGCEIKPFIATNPPRGTISGHCTQLYTMVMTDPDAPIPSEPSLREWVHWMDVSTRDKIISGKTAKNEKHYEVSKVLYEWHLTRFKCLLEEWNTSRKELKAAHTRFISHKWTGGGSEGFNAFLAEANRLIEHM